MLEEKQTNESESSDGKVSIAFKCSPEMAEFIKEKSGDESMSFFIRALIREKMEAEKQPVEAQ